MKLNKVLENRELFKTISIVLIVVIVLFSFALINQPEKEYYDFGNLKIEKTQLDELSNAVGSDRFSLCEIETNECINLVKNNG